jgi:hypothetical protein
MLGVCGVRWGRCWPWQRSGNGPQTPRNGHYERWVPGGIPAAMGVAPRWRDSSSRSSGRQIPAWDLRPHRRRRGAPDGWDHPSHGHRDRPATRGHPAHHPRPRATSPAAADTTCSLPRNSYTACTICCRAWTGPRPRHTSHDTGYGRTEHRTPHHGHLAQPRHRRPTPGRHHQHRPSPPHHSPRHHRTTHPARNPDPTSTNPTLTEPSPPGAGSSRMSRNFSRAPCPAAPGRPTPAPASSAARRLARPSPAGPAPRPPGPRRTTRPRPRRPAAPSAPPPAASTAR